MTVAAVLLAAVLTAGNYEVVIPEKPNAVEKFAAQELREFLGRALVEVKSGSGTPTKVMIYLGRATGIAVSGLAGEEFVIRADGESIRIAGRDADGRWPSSLKSSAPRSTLFGVYELLQRYAGVRMYFPGELGTIIPKRDRLEIPAGEYRFRPDYRIRRYGPSDGSVPEELLIGIEGGTEQAKVEEFKHLNRLRGRYETDSLPVCHGQTRSNFYRRFRNSHPEYFRMLPDGTRMITEALVPPLHKNEHMCHTSAIWDEIYEDAKAYLTGHIADRQIPPRKGFDYDGVHFGNGGGAKGCYYDVMPHDGLKKCACTNCRARYVEGPYWATELIWSNVCSVARRLKDEGIGGYVTTMAYASYASVPRTVDIPDNVLVMLAQAGPWEAPEGVVGSKGRMTGKRDEMLKEWTEKLGHKVWVWTYPDKVLTRRCDDVPQMSPKAWGSYYRRISPYVFGAFAESESDRWLYNHLNYYVFHRVCWDNTVDVDALLDEYYAFMYGRAAMQMKKLFESFEAKWVEECCRNTYGSALGPAVKFPTPKELFERIYSPEVIAGYRKLFDEAEVAVGVGSLEARRVALMRREFLDPLVKRADLVLNGEKGMTLDAR